jgi:putative ABC transport system permease protein
MIYLFLAYRNAISNFKKNAFAVITIGVGLCGLFIFLGYIQNTIDSFREFTIQNGLGHITVASNEAYFRYGESNPFEFEIPGTEGLIKRLESIDEAYAIIPSLVFSCLISFDDKTVSANFKSFKPEHLSFPSEMGSTVPRGPFWFGKLVSGSNMDGSPGPCQVLLGKGVMDILNVEPGQKVTVVAILRDGSVNALDFLVKGSFSSPGMDKVLGIARYDDAKRLLGINGASSISILLKDTSDTQRVFAKVQGILREGYPGMTLHEWSDQAEYYMQVNTMFLSFFVIIASLILVITAFSTINTLNMTVWTRLREFGTMRVIGTQNSRVLIILFLEGMIIGAFGVLGGVSAGYIISFIIDRIGGLPLIFQSQVLMMKTTAHLDSVGWVLLVFSIVSGLAAIVPGIKAIRQNLAENLREI